ncbi:MAG TPA: ankyrin repeat domain-containing protein [Micropepsaceae bacterium]|nr:ankyrin repeat domain-containing protein [Micropepsaceae bacterium]
MTQKNGVERIAAKIKSNPIVTLAIVLSTFVVALSTFTDAAKNLFSMVAEQSPADARAALGRLSLDFTPGDFVKSAKAGDLNAVQLFLAAGMDPNATTSGNAYGTDGEGWTAVMAAAAAGQTSVVAALIKASADVRKSDYKFTALSLAAAAGHIESVRLLLDKGFDAEAVNDAFVDAVSKRHQDVMRLLVDKGADVKKIGPSAIILLLNDGSANGEDSNGGKDVSDIVKAVLDLGADPNGRDSNGWTPLLEAAYGKYPTALRLLLDRGADVNAKCECLGSGYGNSTALMLAARNGGLESVKALLGRGADTSLKDEHGQTALALATTESREPAIIQLLKDAKAPP